MVSQLYWEIEIPIRDGSRNLLTRGNTIRAGGRWVTVTEHRFRHWEALAINNQEDVPTPLVYHPSRVWPSFRRKAQDFTGVVPPSLLDSLLLREIGELVVYWHGEACACTANKEQQNKGLCQSHG